MRRRTSAWRSTTSKPATLARPALGRSSVHSIEMVVDLPAPLGPRNPKVWPGGTLKLTPRTASTSSNRLIKPSAWMAAAPSAAGPAAACLEALRTRISHSVVCRHPRFELVLELADVLEAGDVVVGVAARAAGGAAGGGQQAELLVVPQGAAGDAHPGGSLADPQLSGPLGHADIDSSASDIIVDSCSACT